MPMVAQCVLAPIVTPMEIAHDLAIPFASNDSIPHPESPTSLPTADIWQLLLLFDKPELESAWDLPSWSTSEMVKQLSWFIGNVHINMSYLAPK
jgi:hypothetical protein